MNVQVKRHSIKILHVFLFVFPHILMIYFSSNHRLFVSNKKRCSANFEINTYYEVLCF